MIPTMKKPMKKKPQPDPQKSRPEPKAQSPEPSTHSTELPATGSQPEFTEETAIAIFARHLDELKWQYHRYNDQPVLFCGFNGVDALWDFNMVARAKNDGQFLLAISSFIPNKARPDRRVAVAEMLSRLNWELTMGCFEMNHADGEIRFRTSVMLPAADITDGIVKHLLGSNLAIVDERINQIMAVLYSSTSPEDAIKPKEAKADDNAQPRFDFN